MTKTDRTAEYLQTVHLQPVGLQAGKQLPHRLQLNVAFVVHPFGSLNLCLCFERRLWLAVLFRTDYTTSRAAGCLKARHPAPGRARTRFWSALADISAPAPPAVTYLDTGPAGRSAQKHLLRELGLRPEAHITIHHTIKSLSLSPVFLKH